MKIDFTKSNGIFTYSDALNLPDDHTFTDEEIEKMKQERFDRWLSIVNFTQPTDESLNTDSSI